MNIKVDKCDFYYREKGVKYLGFPEGIRGDIIMCGINTANFSINTCQGDSGSAVTWKSDEDVNYVVSITSSGLSCTNELPSFYTKVGAYLDWIEAIVWK